MFNTKKRKQKDSQGKFLTFENLYWSKPNLTAITNDLFTWGHYLWAYAVSWALCHIILEDLDHQLLVCHLPGGLLTSSSLKCLSRYMTK